MTELRNSIVLFEPQDIKVSRVDGSLFDDGIPRIREESVTIPDDPETDPVTLIVYHRADEFNSYIVAVLNALGFPESDLEYVAQRLIREVSNASTQPQGTTND